MTRGEPRPVHITLIGNDCHLSGLHCQFNNSVVVVRRLTPGLSCHGARLRNLDRPANQRSFERLAGPGAESVVRKLQPAQKAQIPQLQEPRRGLWQLRTVIGLQQARGWWPPGFPR